MARKTLARARSSTIISPKLLELQTSTIPYFEAFLMLFHFVHKHFSLKLIVFMWNGQDLIFWWISDAILVFGWSTPYVEIFFSFLVYFLWSRYIWKIFRPVRSISIILTPYLLPLLLEKEVRQIEKTSWGKIKQIWATGEGKADKFE